MSKTNKSKSTKKSPQTQSNKQSNFQKPYNKDNRIKVDNYKPPVKNSIVVEKAKKIAELSESLKVAAAPDIERSMGDAYAQEVIVWALIHNIFSGSKEEKEANLKKLQEDYEKGLIADKNWQLNMETQEEFKTAYKYLKILEVKIKDENLSEKDFQTLANDKEKVKNQLDQIAQKFDFDDGITKIKFKNKEQAEALLDKIETGMFENSYRQDITSDSEVLKISKTKIKDLHELAVETKGLKNPINQANLDTKLNQSAEVVAGLAKVVSPVAMAMK